MINEENDKQSDRLHFCRHPYKSLSELVAFIEGNKIKGTGIPYRVTMDEPVMEEIAELSKSNQALDGLNVEANDKIRDLSREVVKARNQVSGFQAAADRSMAALQKADNRVVELELRLKDKLAEITELYVDGDRLMREKKALHLLIEKNGFA